MATQTLHDVLESTVELAAPRASQAGLGLHCHLEPACREIVNFDAWCVSQLVSNLLSNALAYTASGEVRVFANCKPEPGQARFELRVTDTGPGIAPEVRRVMFTLPDQRESLQGAQRIGFGLVIARQLCELINAELSIDDAPGGGTVATVVGTFTDYQKPRQSDHPLPDALRDSHALVIDSDIAARRLLEAHLRSWDISVTTVLDIPTGIARLRESQEHGVRISMVFVSADTPTSALATFVDMLRATPQYADLLLVMLGKDEGSGSFATLSGPIANMTLSKPVRPSALFDCIARHPQVRAMVSGPNAEHGQTTPRRVLLVEDNIVNQCVATEILKRIGVHVEVANHGGEALEALQAQPFDFVFMDCQMPEMDGFDATRAIREMPQFQKLPVVALTANALSGDRQRCLDAGMSDYLTKPFTKEQLETMLDKWLDGNLTGCRSLGSYSDTIVVDLIDESALNQIRMLDDDGDNTIFNEILDEFFDSSENLTRSIREAARDGDCDEVARCAHALKSSAAAVGLAHFSSQCTELEMLAREHALEGLRALWATAERTYERSAAALGERRERRVA